MRKEESLKETKNKPEREWLNGDQWSKVLRKGVKWAVSMASEKLSNTGDIGQLNFPGSLNRSRRLKLVPELKS